MTKLTKPVRRTVDLDAPHGIALHLVVSLYPGGVLGLRESRRRKEVFVPLVTVYERALIAEADLAARTRRTRRRRK